MCFTSNRLVLGHLCYAIILNSLQGCPHHPRDKTPTLPFAMQCWFFPKVGLLSHIWYAKKQKRNTFETLPAPLTYSLGVLQSEQIMYISIFEPIKILKLSCAGHPSPFFPPAWWMCNQRRSDKSHYLMINHPLCRLHSDVLVTVSKSCVQTNAL